MTEEESLPGTLRARLPEGMQKKVRLKETEAIWSRLHDFGPKCAVCTRHLTELDDRLRQFAENPRALEAEDVASHRKNLRGLKGHLRKEHGLVSHGYFAAIHFMLGVALGFALGAIGYATGLAMDVHGRKTGKTI